MEKKILIIDDNADDRETYIRALKKVEQIHYEHVEAFDGMQGLDIIKQDPPDLYIA